MSTVIEDTTGQMAQRMLAGWTLSDQICPVANCNVPLLTKGAEQFCARCSGATTNGHTAATADSESSSDVALSVSTPPTPSSALPDPPIAPPRTSEAQRDAAAREIGNLLLKGWCLLGDECPRCPGIPLMSRPRPRPAPQPDAGPSSGRRGASSSSSSAPAIPTVAPPGKLCVNCRTEYMPPGYNAATPAEPPMPTGGAAARKRARLAEDVAANPLASTSSVKKGKAAAVTARSLEDVAATASQPLQALEAALAVLTRQMETVTGSVPVNVAAIAETADAMGKTARAIADVRAFIV